MYHMPEGIYFGQSDEKGFRAVLTNKEVRWRIEGWWQINSGDTVTVYAGNLKEVLIHVRNSAGEHVVPDEFDRKGAFPVHLTHHFRVDSLGDDGRIEASWRKKNSDRWNVIHHPHITDLYTKKAKEESWKSVMFFEVDVNDGFVVRE